MLLPVSHCRGVVTVTTPCAGDLQLRLFTSVCSAVPDLAVPVRSLLIDTIATFAGSPSCIGSPAACVRCTIQHIVGVCKEKSDRREFFAPSVRRNQRCIDKFIAPGDCWNVSKGRRPNCHKT
jgi:hypothetical protein